MTTGPVTVTTASGVVEFDSFGQGLAVLALHGAMGGCDQGLVLARALTAGGVHVIAPSRPGYLGTPLSSGAAPAAQADLYSALLDHLGVEDVVVIAASAGGVSATQFALRHPSRCRALVLVSACSESLTTPIPLSFRLKTALLKVPFLVQAIERRIARHPEQAARRAIADPEQRVRTIADPEAGPLLAALLASMSGRLAARLAGTQNDISNSRSVDCQLEAIRVPTLVIHGMADAIVPFERHAGTLVRRIPDARLMAINEGGHLCVVTHLSEIRARTQAFFAELGSFVPNAPSPSGA